MNKSRYDVEAILLCLPTQSKSWIPLHVSGIYAKRYRGGMTVHGGMT
ncbi:hypothetical protein [Wolbachia endosymbiont (group A) of Rhinocyllus conicus]|nr:hypothetical protein [Wolbachia endosymbiont (group A) of Rhinocyllus conicus]